MNKSHDYIVDSENLFAKQHLIMAIGQWETSPKTEEGKPTSQRLKSDVSSSTPRTNGFNMKKST